MKIRQIDGSGDWNFGRGLSNILTDEAAIEENVKTRLLLWKGEVFWDLQAGVDWKGRLDSGQQTFLKEEIRTMILKSYGVTSVDSISLIFDGVTRNALIQATISTIFSTSFQFQLNFAAGDYLVPASA